MANSAIRLRAMLDFESESGEKRVAGDEWLFEGPGTAPPYCVVQENIHTPATKGISDKDLPPPL